jgi:hypothetical protein
MNMKVPLPESHSTRMIEPAMTPGRLPAISSSVSGLTSLPSRPNRRSTPGTAATLNRRLVGVTAGLGTPRMLS